MLRDMRIANFIGELVSGAVMALAVPLAILAVGMPVAFMVRTLLSAFGLL